MTHPLTPREKVARAVYDTVTRFDGDTVGTHLGLSSMIDASALTVDDERSIVMSVCEDVADSVLTALASGSGDHAELARLAEAAICCEDANYPAIRSDFGKAANPATVLALLAEVAALRAQVMISDVDAGDITATNADLSARATEAERALSEHRIAADLLVSSLKSDLAEAERELGAVSSAIGTVRFMDPPDGGDAPLSEQVRRMASALTEAERKLAEAEEVIKEIAAIEPKPFDGGLDMEAIRACEECRRYEGHPVQHGICNTHRRPIWDREKHDSRVEKALGYRAKSIARTFLSKEAERG